MFPTFTPQELPKDSRTSAANIDVSHSPVHAVCLLAALLYGMAAFAQDIPEENGTAENSETDPSTEAPEGEEEEKKKGGKFLILPIFPELLIMSI